MKAQQLAIRRNYLKTPKHARTLLPCEEIELQTNQTVEDGIYAFHPNVDAGKVAPVIKWLGPQVGQIKNGMAKIKNDSPFAQHVAGKNNIVEFVPMADPEILELINDGSAAPELQMEPTHKDISLDPDHLLSQQVKTDFANTNERFSRVFQSDLPQYNGCFGAIEASITNQGICHNLAG